MKRIRLSFAVTESVKDRLERLKEKAGCESLTEVLRNALFLYEEMLDVDGQVFVKDGKSERELKIIGIRGDR